MISPMPSDGTIGAFAPFSFAPPPADAPATTTNTHAWKDGSFSFHDLLDTINPLQHIPLVSSVYRWLTGDELGNVARLAGDTLYGGPLGLAAGLFGVAFKEETGKDPGEMALAALTGSDSTPAAIAAAAPAASASGSGGSGASPDAAIASNAPAAAQTPPAAPTEAAATAAPAPAVPDHPPIPLHKSPAAPAPQAVASTSPAEQTFLSERAQFQRSVSGRHTVTASGRPITPPVPLQLTGQVLPGMQRRVPSGLIVPPPGIAEAAAVEPAATTDIPQRMMDALDKYRQIQQQRGGQVDLAP